MAKVARLQIQRSIEQGDLNPVGMLVYSMLTEAQFQGLNGTSWILADGRSIAGSSYATVTGNSTAPDLRGEFLRGTDNGRGVDTGRVLGTFQAHEFNSHTHIQNSHSHNENVRADLPLQVAGTGYRNAQQGVRAGRDEQGFGTTHGTADSINTNSIAASTPTNQNSGGAETRPRNVSANCFIKIN